MFECGAWGVPPNDVRGFVHKRILGAAKGFLTGGVGGAVQGFVSKGGSRSGRTPRAIDQVRVVPVSSRQQRRGEVPFILTSSVLPRSRQTVGALAAPAPSAAQCAPGQLRVGGLCIDPLGTGLPGFGIAPVPQTPTTTGVSTMPTGQAVVGSFGLPAMVPETVGSIRRRDGTVAPIRRCGPRMVLGTDDLCYPKALLPRRSKFRKWRQPPRPAVSAGDVKAIRRAGRAKDRVLVLAKSVGLHASKTRPKPAAKKGHQHLLAAPQLRVISEETN